jgi:hypothetical protein
MLAVFIYLSFFQHLEGKINDSLLVSANLFKGEKKR